jgi:hypothetical protein
MPVDIAVGILGYFFLVHLIARRGYKTGLYYWPTFMTAAIPLFLPFVFFRVFWRNKRKGTPYYRIPPKKL